MAFDRTNPADVAALKTEIDTDPIGMGYQAVYDQQGPMLKLLNDPDENVGGETAARPFTAEALLDALDPTEFGDNQTAVDASAYVNALLAHVLVTGDISSYKAKFRALFAANSATVAALDAQTASLSRAEVLFGQGTVISKDDWVAARDS